jgi:hypothetical protein
MHDLQPTSECKRMTAIVSERANAGTSGSAVERT